MLAIAEHNITQFNQLLIIDCVDHVIDRNIFTIHSLENCDVTSRVDSSPATRWLIDMKANDKVCTNCAYSYVSSFLSCQVYRCSVLFMYLET